MALIKSSSTKRIKKVGKGIKSSLFQIVLPDLKDKSPYFSLPAVKKALEQTPFGSVNDETLRGYMSEAMASGLIHDAGRGWYSRHKTPLHLDPKPVSKIISVVAGLFPLLDFSCWSTLQFNPFARHLLAQPLILLYAPTDTLESVADRLRDLGWNAWVNPGKNEVDRLVRPGEKTVILRPAISKQPEGTKHIAPMEKALVDFLVESEKLKLTDPTESQRILDEVLSTGLIQLSVLLGYAERRNIPIQTHLATH